MRSGSFWGSQIGADPTRTLRGGRSETLRWVATGLGIGLVLLVAGVTMQQRRLERADDSFRRRTAADEYCFDHAMNSVACNGNPYAEF